MPQRPGPASLRMLLGLAPTAAASAVRAQLRPPLDPRANARLLLELKRWGTTPALGFAAGAVRHPGAPAVIDLDDPVRSVTFAEAERRTRAAAAALAGRHAWGAGVRAGVLGRNSRAYVEALAAGARTGADVVLLNPGHSAQQLAAVARREGITRFLADPDLVDRCPGPVLTLAGGDWEDLAGGPGGAFRPSAGPGRHVLLTSGTTGVPRGAARGGAPIEAAVGLLAAFPFRQRGTHVLAAPLFHAWGWMHLRLAALLDATIVLMRRADPLRVLQAAAQTSAGAIITVPVVAQRMVELPLQATAGLDLSALRVVAYSGSAMPADAVRAFSRRYGDVLHNLYGSTEAAFATVATPADLRADPASAGRPLPGVVVRILDEDGAELPAGRTGRIFAGSATSFEGYTDGSDRDRVRGLVWTGDVGHLDDHGRLRVQGRVDDVMVVGGENVHPLEVEEVLREHPDVLDLAVAPRLDARFGHRPVAHVVLAQEQPSDWDDAFLAWARERLAPAQRPAAVVRRPALPRNAAGKIVRRDLVEP